MSDVVDAAVIGLFEAAPLVLAAMGFILIYYLSGFLGGSYADKPTRGACLGRFLARDQRLRTG